MLLLLGFLFRFQDGSKAFDEKGMSAFTHRIPSFVLGQVYGGRLREGIEVILAEN